jgi:hypothetical protein
MYMLQLPRGKVLLVPFPLDDLVWDLKFLLYAELKFENHTR